MKVRYPAECILNDFNWCPAHPFKEAYIRYKSMPYDNVMFDPTAVVYGVGGTSFFTSSEVGTVDVDSLGVTRFTPDPSGHCRIIYLSDESAPKLLDYFKGQLKLRPTSSASAL